MRKAVVERKRVTSPVWSVPIPSVCLCVCVCVYIYISFSFTRHDVFCLPFVCQSAFVGAVAVADLVKTTLGPKGMDKILQPINPDGMSKVTFTNDGATILNSIPVDNPAAKILVDVARTQDEEVGDGTTSVTVFAGELLREAEKLVAGKMHPQTIIRGWRKAVVAAREALEASAVNHSEDPDKFREDLLNIARTTLSSKILSSSRDQFAQMAVDAVLRLKGSSDLRNIQLIKKVGGSLEDSYLDEGFILDKRIGVGQPKRMENCRILVANTGMDSDKIKIHGASVKVGSVAKVAEIEEAEKLKMKRKVERILKHDMNVFVNRQLIYDYPDQLFAEAGVMAIEHADFEGVERVALVTGAEIVSTFDTPEEVRTGRCDLIEEIMIGEETVIRFSGGVKGEACSIVLRGSSQQILDEAERSMHDALSVLTQTVKEPRVTLGAGAAEMLMASAVDECVKTTAGKESLAVEAFARALRQLPSIIADNAGLDSAELVSQLRAAHHAGETYMGLDLNNGKIEDIRKLQITEPFKLKHQMLVSAHEAAEMILRVNQIIRCAPRKRGGHDHHH